MSKKIVFYPGYIKHDTDSNRKYPRYGMGSMLIVGLAGSGKTVLTTNILMQLITLYSQDEIDIRVWDGKGTEYVRNWKQYKECLKTRIDQIDVISEAYNGSEKNLQVFLESAKNEIYKRVEYLTSHGLDSSYARVNNDMKQLVLFIEEPCATYYDFWEVLRDDLHFILRYGWAVDVHVIISSQPCVSFFKNMPFRYILSTRLDAESKEVFLGPVSKCGIDYARYGEVVVTEANTIGAEKYCVPFYEDSKIVEVGKGNLAPNGWVPDNRQKANLLKFMER